MPVAANPHPSHRDRRSRMLSSAGPVESAAGSRSTRLTSTVAVRPWRRMTGDRAMHESCADFPMLEPQETETRHDR
jgi:hypothetical protein